LAQPPVKAALVSEKDMRAQHRVLARIEKQELLSAALFLLALAGMLTPYRMFPASGPGQPGGPEFERGVFPSDY